MITSTRTGFDIIGADGKLFLVNGDGRRLFEVQLTEVEFESRQGDFARGEASFILANCASE
jgi:hypothetical protein